jgi:hypothetical protein
MKIRPNDLNQIFSLLHCKQKKTVKREKDIVDRKILRRTNKYRKRNLGRYLDKVKYKWFKETLKVYNKYQMVMGCLHDKPVSNGGQLQAMQGLKTNKLLLLLLSSSSSSSSLIPSVKRLTSKSATIIRPVAVSEN